jgi:hypothetical protein
MDACPDPDELRELIAGPVPADRQLALERHLEACACCQARLDSLDDFRAVGPPQGHTPVPGSTALERAIEQLRAEAELLPGTVRLDPVAEWHQTGLPALQPTDRPGFLGRLGPFEVRRLVGRGGMGLVFEGLDPVLGRPVAVKVLSPLVAAGPEARERFFREARAAAALTHEHIVTIHAVDQVGGFPFLVLQYVPGESLADRLRRVERLPLADVVRIGTQVAWGLAAAHDKGLIHRDIKPANILLEEGTDRAKIADFGLAKAADEDTLTVEGTIAGTPEFMSPEQAAGRAVDARADLFSLGAVLYLAATGVSPFRGDTPLVTLDRVRRESPTPVSQVDPSLPDWFSQIVDRLLEKDPDRRVPTAAEAAAMLSGMGAAPTVSIPRGDHPTLAVRRARQASGRARWLWRAAAAVGVAVAAVAIGFHFGRPGDAPPENVRPPVGTPQPIAFRPPESGFVVAGRAETYSNLHEAVQAAADGGVVEVYGNGPFPTPAVRTERKGLTVRAAGGSRPVLVPDGPRRRGSLPLFTAGADLTLEGLEIRWPVQAPFGSTEADVLANCAVVATGGRLTLTHCRIETGGRRNGCVGASGADVELRNCQFDGLIGVFWRPASGGQLSATGCQFEGQFALSVYPAAVTPTPEPASVLWESNTVAADKALQLILDERPKQPLHVTARHNLIDSARLVFPMALRTGPRIDTLEPEQMVSGLRSMMTWTEAGNVYRRGCEYLVCTAVLGPKDLSTKSAGVDDVGHWLAVWDLPPTQSVEGRIRFRERAATSTTQPLQLAGVDEPSGEVPATVGAVADRVGPGAAYYARRAADGQ